MNEFKRAVNNWLGAAAGTDVITRAQADRLEQHIETLERSVKEFAPALVYVDRTGDDCQVSTVGAVEVLELDFDRIEAGEEVEVSERFLEAFPFLRNNLEQARAARIGGRVPRSVAAEIALSDGGSRDDELLPCLECGAQALIDSEYQLCANCE